MSFIEFAVFFSLALTTISLGLLFVRFVIGPTLEDRVISIDILSVVGIGFIAIYAMLTLEKVLLDVAVILGLVSFLGTVAFAYYLEQRKRK